jgi:adenine-specific DNA-methyltransferase
MNTRELNPKQALNKAFLKIKPNRTEIEIFKSNLITLLDKLKTVEKRPKDESEEHLKTDIRDFLRDTFYKDTNAINTKDKKDLVIHLSKDTNSKVGVIIEAKRPSNKSEMLTKDNLNKKALHELVLYYLRERITLKNLDVKHLIVTNINEWYIFDEHLFERLFNKKELVKQFESFEFGKKSTSVFYKEIAEPFIQGIKNEIEYTYFNLKDYESALRNQDKKDDKQLIELFKLLSPPHLLKLPFNNDSNSLDKNFYGELLHIIGLVEVKDGGKKLIQRPDLKNRNSGSLLENTINQLDSLDKLSRLTNITQYGENHEERLFNVGLELCITWINRILFLKLLEAQLISYHKGDTSYSFLNLNLIHDYDSLNSLFFMVLAKKTEERNQRVKDLFSKVPYLNSSLFEPTILEHEAIFISGLEDNIPLPFQSSTVIKDNNGNKEKGTREALRYLFEFLNSYNFTSEGTDAIQEENKTLINASVLGLIFEKINGYKDGSFFTPGFITEYMCRETIRRSVVQKFNEIKAWDCIDFNDLFNKIDHNTASIVEANEIVNEIKICDPAVGSGHFLVSALNEILSIKNDLKILQDKQGKRLKGYDIQVINDELVVTDEDGNLFEYNPFNPESRRIQETLFHEKQIIIENCLFGVDINPNSVKICRLRLWIELLKNAYYKNSDELETLPNIDINIKCGNSLVSRFSVDADLKEILKKSQWTIDSYKGAVDQYRNAVSKDQKREMEKLIDVIKSEIKVEFGKNDTRQKKLEKLGYEFFLLTGKSKYGTGLQIEFEETHLNKVDKVKALKLEQEIELLTNQITEIKSNKIYENAFEWRFEFPEVLNSDGDFIGFDVVIGNPPYVSLYGNKGNSIDPYTRLHYQNNYSHVKGSSDRINLMNLFVELSKTILKQNGNTSLIVNKTIAVLPSYIHLRDFILKNVKINYLALDFSPFEAIVDCLIIDFTNTPPLANYEINYLTKDFESTSSINIQIFNKNRLSEFVYSNFYGILEKVDSASESIGDLININRGVNIGGCFNDFLNSEKISNKYFKYLSGTKNIKQFKYEWGENDGYCKLDLDLETELRKKGKTLVLGDISRFYKPKIFIPESSQIITAVYSDQEYCSAYGIMVGTNKEEKDVSLHFIVGLLNSSVINFYCIEKEILRKGNKATPHVGVKGINSIPVIRNPEIEQKIILLSKNIHSAKINLEDSKNLEKELNKCVFQLYNLTTEEIEIIEGS